MACNKSKKKFKITVTSTNVRARPGNPTDSLGTLSTDSGTVNPDGTKKITFVPNGNYGTAAFKVTIDGITSDTVTLPIIGEFKEEAQARLDEEVKKVQDAAAILKVSVGAVTGILALLLGLAGILTLNVIKLLAALAVALAGMYIFGLIEATMRKNVKEMKKRSAPFISNLPPKEQ